MMKPSSGGVRRYNLALPESLYRELFDLSRQRATTVQSLLQQFIKLGFIALDSEKRGAQLIVREEKDGKIVEQRLLIL